MQVTAPICLTAGFVLFTAQVIKPEFAGSLFDTQKQRKLPYRTEPHQVIVYFVIPFLALYDKHLCGAIFTSHGDSRNNRRFSEKMVECQSCELLTTAADLSTDEDLDKDG